MNFIKVNVIQRPIDIKNPTVVCYVNTKNIQLISKDTDDNTTVINLGGASALWVVESVDEVLNLLNTPTLH